MYGVVRRNAMTVLHSVRTSSRRMQPLSTPLSTHRSSMNAASVHVSLDPTPSPPVRTRTVRLCVASNRLSSLIPTGSDPGADPFLHLKEEEDVAMAELEKEYSLSVSVSSIVSTVDKYVLSSYSYRLYKRLMAACEFECHKSDEELVAKSSIFLALTPKRTPNPQDSTDYHDVPNFSFIDCRRLLNLVSAFEV